MAIWSHVAGQTTATAPSPLAFVTAIVHGVGAFVPTDGIGTVPRSLAAAAREAGVEFEFGTTVAKIVYAGRRVRGVTTADGRLLEADAVVSNRNGVGTYLELVRDALPVGVCAGWSSFRCNRPAPVLTWPFEAVSVRLTFDSACRGMASCAGCSSRPPRSSAGSIATDGRPARLIVPMAYGEAQRVGRDGQRAYLDRALSEPWWREHVAEARVLETRLPADWGAACHLYRQSMNPVMTARSMRAAASLIAAHTSIGSTYPAARLIPDSGSVSARSPESWLPTV